MFNPFNLCVIDKSSERIYRKEDVDEMMSFSSDNTIVLFELKNRIGENKRFKLGDVYFNEEEKKYYIFTLIKSKDYLEWTTISGFGFFVFGKKIEFPHECKLIHGINFIKEKKINYVGNIFVNKDEMKSDINCQFFDEYYIYLLKLNNISFHTEFNSKKEGYFTLINLKKDSTFYRNKLMEKEFDFSILYHQKNVIESKNNTFTLINGALFEMRKESKELLSDKKVFKDEILYNTRYNIDSIPKEIFENSLLFFDRFFIFLEDGFVKIQSLNTSFDNDNIDYSLYLKITGKYFIVLTEKDYINKYLLELINN